MKNIYRVKSAKSTAIIVLLIIFGLFEAKAQWPVYNGMPIAYWDFQNTAANPTTFQTTVKQQVNSGNIFNGKFGGATTTISGVNGNGISSYSGSHAGKAMSAGGWSAVSSDPGTAATTYYEFSLNTTGFSGIQIGFDVEGTGASYPKSGICYSTDGGASWTAGTSFSNGNTWDNGCACTLSSGANNNSSLEIRIYGWNSNNTAGCTLVLDNLFVFATGTVANAGTLNLLNEQDIQTSIAPGTYGMVNRKSFTVVGPNTNVVVNGSYNSVFGSPFYSEIAMNLNQTFAVTSSGSVSFGSLGDICSVGKFTLNSGCTIYCPNANGISANGDNSNANGSVIVSGTKTYDANANYVFNGTAAQITNTGFPISLTGALTINNSAGITLTNSLTTSGTINLQSGGLMLNGNTLDVTNNSVSAITTTSGYIQSETNSAINPSTVTLAMASGAPLTYVFPFGASGTQIPFTFVKTTTASVNVTASTRETGSDNTPYAGASDLGTIPAVSNMACAPSGDPSTSVIDRWWDIYADAAVTANITFSYLGSEDATMSTNYQIGQIQAAHWNGTSWDAAVGAGIGSNSGVGTVSVNNVSTFSPWVLIGSEGSALPISLTNFTSTCEEKYININWTTASEVNNDYFTLQRSHDGEEYKDIMRVKGSGNTNETKSYSTIDNSPLSGMAYYRLKQTDFNGKSTIFPEIVSDCGKSGINIINIYPDFNTKSTKLFFNSAEQTQYTIAIYDLLGNKLISTTKQAESGNNEVEINCSGLDHSVYFIVLSSDSQVLTRKVIF